jgi:hypothetical protein
MHFGFGTRSVFGNVSNNQAEIILYRTNGTVYEGGQSKETRVSSQTTDKIESEVDLIENKVCWTKNGVTITTSNLP